MATTIFPRPNTVADVQVAGTSVVNGGVANISTFTGATSLANGAAGAVPQPLIADAAKFLKGDGTWGEVEPGLPAVTSSDNGKVLAVVNGAWAAATIPSATGVSF